ncbi:glycosyl hydrolase family 95 catalytic domain-containing protein [Novipirellula herctigrandis]|uniref:glycoside hydrolase family 95 protein n=1 Tax=Novipirellula herctigrandis TaxID=2527986 RepID=UPI003AF3A041
MNRIPTFVIAVITIFVAGAANCHANDSSKVTLWYDRPAVSWSESLPIGNGRWGAMMHGDPAADVFYLNEETVWSGGPHDYTNVGSHQYLEPLRKLIREEKYDEAAEFGAAHSLGVPRKQQGYQNLGKLHLECQGHDSYSDYRRQLDLSTGLVEIKYKVGGATFTRQILASHPDDVIAIRLSCDQPGKISFTTFFSTEHTPQNRQHVGTNGLNITGTSSSRNGIEGKIHFESQIQVSTEGGSVSTDENRLSVTGADAATLVLVAATNYVDYQDVSGDPQSRCADCLSKIQQSSFADLKKRHIADHRGLFNRLSLDLGGTESDASIPTDRLIQKMLAGEHSALLEEQLFQFARYLSIAGARPGTQPLNLVGIWAEGLSAPWGGKWTLNINAELNTWPTETTNLAECHEPLLALIEDVRVTGRKVAREHYKCGGFVVHHNTDLWRGAAPVDTSIHGLWTLGGAWLSRHIWEHYDFSRDVEFLRKSYPTMREAAEFFVDYLTQDKDGYLSTCPAISFEQTFILADGRKGRLTYGPTMDNQILYDLFSNCIAATKVLDIDPDFREQLGAIRSKLRPTKIDSKTGRLMEWAFPAEQTVVSGQTAPLWAISPGRAITPHDTPELAAAAVKHLVYTIPKIPVYQRGGSWITGTLLNEWARLGEPEQAYKTIHKAITQYLYPNLMMHFYTQKYFQIDGNMGTCAGMTEMLMQSHRLSDSGQPIVDLLPALPQAWPTGSVSGLCGRGAFVFDLQWRNGKLLQVDVTSLKGTPLTMCYDGKAIVLETEANQKYHFDGNLSR